jgi:hypothetical protein
VKCSIVCLIVPCTSHSPAQELSSKWKAGPINASVLISKTTVLPSNPADRGLLVILVIMFLAGVVLACSEVVKWWKARMTQYRPPPLAGLITYVRDLDRSWRATHVLWFPLPTLRSIPERLQPSVQNVQEDQPEKAA